MTESKIVQFEKLVRKSLIAATELYGFSKSELDPDKVDIRFDIRSGRLAGQARWSMEGTKQTFALRFNVQAMELDWNHMTGNTIPHEVAHIVCMARPSLGDNHNKGWKRIARSLGSDGERCHSLKLAPVRNIPKFEYILDDGTTISIGQKRHNAVQAGRCALGLFMRPAYTESGTKQYIFAHHYTTMVAPIPKPKQVKVKTGPTKKSVAGRIYMEMTMSATPARKDVINRMVVEAGLTPAGAATYYATFKKATEARMLAEMV